MKKNLILLLNLIFLVFSSNLLFSNKKEIPNAISKGNSCIERHEKLEGKLKTPIIYWKNSVHAKALKNCNMCHGGNPEIFDEKEAKSKKFNFIGKPSKKVITNFCGRGGCHSEALLQFKKGPHYKSVLKSNHPNCTDCHGIHNIQKSTLKIINEKSCTSCHDSEYSKDIIKEISVIEKDIDKISNDIKFLKKHETDITNLRLEISKIKNLFHQLVHVFSKEDMKTTKKIMTLSLKNITTEVTTKILLTKRLKILYLVMLILGLLTIIIITAYSIMMFSKRRE